MVSGRILTRFCLWTTCLIVLGTHSGLLADGESVSEGESSSGPPSLEWEWRALGFHLGPEDGLIIRPTAAEGILHIGGVLVGQAIDYDDRNSRDSGARLERATFRVDGAYGNLYWRIAPDLKGIDTRGGFEEAYIAYTCSDYFRVTAGLVEVPLTVEHSIPEEELAFVGYSFPVFLDTRTDLALRFDGEIEDGLFSYALAATAGEGFTRLGDRVSGNQFSARGTLYPLRAIDYSIALLNYEIPLLSGLFVSGGYSYTLDYEGPLRVPNSFRNVLFTVSRFDADASDFFYFAYGADLGPLRVVHEIVQGGYRNADTPQGRETLDGQTTAWSLTGSWMITGENYDSRPFRLRRNPLRRPPRKPLFWGEGPSGWGALEIAARYANADIDRDFFSLGSTGFNTSSQEFRTFSAALNWYPVAHIKASFQIIRNIADQRPRTFDSHGRDTSYMFQLQYVF